MYDAACLSEPGSLQRARGELHVSVKRRGPASVLDGLRQSGCLKARFPRAVFDGWADVVTLNTSGGVVGGDRLQSAFGVQPGARATIAAQAAERFYRALPGGLPSQVQTHITVGDNAAAEWLPQETILFDGCAVDRTLEVELSADSWFLGLETLVFGRAAMGERVRQAWLRDLIRVRRDGRLLLHDAVRLDGEVDALLQRTAIANGARALATIVHVAPDAEQALEPVRSALSPSATPDLSVMAGEGPPSTTCTSSPEAAASAWDGMLLTRILAPDAASLRRAVIATLRCIRGTRPLPRVWLC